MNHFERATATQRALPSWVLWVSCCALSLAVACGDATPSAPGSGSGSGSGGTGGTGGMAGVAGTGGTAGTGGSAGNGGEAGISGMGGAGAAGGSAGIGGAQGECATNALCHTCPDSFLCDTDNDCAFSGYVCVASGCATHGGDPIKQCVPSWAGSCSTDNDCPNAGDYDCLTVGAGGKRCIRVAAGCDAATETYDCAPGFSCENDACVDRRVPCDSFLDCPKSHICITTPVSKYCARASRSCNVDVDCSWLGNNFGSFCADVDNDGRDECAGERDASGEACLSSDCGTSVCETGAVGSAATCGDFGLCRLDGDCGDGFECVALWEDGRSECVPVEGSCDRASDCAPQQVCAASRSGNPPSCQAGTAP